MISIQKLLNQLQPCSPIPTDLSKSCQPDPSIRAVVFDIYGTLLVSATGDINGFELSGNVMRKALSCAGADLALMSEPAITALCQACVSDYKRFIKRHQQTLKTDHGLPFPEVDIMEVWRDIMVCQEAHGRISEEVHVDIKTLAFAFEQFSNQVWPMPHMNGIIQHLKERNLPLGIISNAQFYTPRIVNFFIDNDEAGNGSINGFDPDLCMFSYEHNRAKPDRWLFDQVVTELGRKYGINATEALYVGNDIYKDIYPAKQAGMKAALFAGDKRSLRLRSDQPEASQVSADFVIKSLTDLREIVV